MMDELEFDESVIEVRLSRWIFSDPIRRKKDQYIIGLSGHCDFNYLMKHVSFCDPGYVITKSSNGESAKALAREIRRRLRKPSVTMS